MTAEQINNLPDHLKGIDFKEHHVYINTKTIKGKTITTMTASENFIVDMMRQFELEFTADLPYIGPFREGKTLIVTKVVIKSKDGRETPAISSVDAMPYEKSGSGTHLAQLGLTQAKKKGVLNHLHISPNDIKLLVEAFDIDIKQNSDKMSIRTTDDAEETTDGEETVIEPVEDVSLSLDEEI